MSKGRPEPVLRNLNPDADVPGLVQLLTEIEGHDQLGSDTSAAALRAQFDWPDHDPARDRCVFETPDDGRLVGHASTVLQSPLRAFVGVVVHPDSRRRGLGTALLQAIAERAREKGATQIVASAGMNNPTGHPFLLARGFQAAGHARFFTATSEVQFDAPVWPAGFTLRTFSEISDIAVLAEGSNRCYADMWGHRENLVPASVEHFQKHMADWPDYYQPDGILIVFHPEGQLAGICFSRVEGEGKKKVIDSPAVVPQCQHLGLQRPLVQASARWLNQQAAGEIHLHTWGDSEQAAEIYRQLGFTLGDESHVVEYVFHFPGN